MFNGLSIDHYWNYQDLTIHLMDVGKSNEMRQSKLD